MSDETGGLGGQGQLAVDVGQVGSQIRGRDVAGRHAVGGRSPLQEASLGSGRRIPEPPPAPHVVAHPRDLPPCVRDRCHQVVGVGELEGRRNLVLILEEQFVVLAPGHSVQLDADVGEQAGGRSTEPRSA